MNAITHSKSDPRIVVIGGGTGSFTVLTGLKQITSDLIAIVNMVDDGGSTGILRDELGALPPGDVRQCLVALSESPKVRELFNYRFPEGTFRGHPFGNILLSALEKMTGSFLNAIETASEILRVKGSVIPATLDNVRLHMQWADTSLALHGERVIDAEHFARDPRRATLKLIPSAVANPDALNAIRQADLVIISPGDLYTSLGPLLIIPGIGEALRSTNAPIIYVANLVTKRGQTEGFTVVDHAREIERFVGDSFLDYVLYNNQKPTREMLKRYKEEDAYIVQKGDISGIKSYKAIAGKLLGKVLHKHEHDVLPVTRSFIRHDPLALAYAIMEIYADNKR